jgi:hypothetical protein
MGYIPDLEVSSSIKKKKANGANMPMEDLFETTTGCYMQCCSA